ncbi:unnamed protein product [Protopolystoma xenopodis]|uniref:Uncharacterized protein n=1 Tax=Protopolystoma xenopodis TaxID=117903 RepID=A0A448WV17_9PLAT|nr:unnamed protein product [Protopolystoma xenopodis]
MRRSCLLVTPDTKAAAVWFNALHSVINTLNQACLAELNRLLPRHQTGTILT